MTPRQYDAINVSLFHLGAKIGLNLSRVVNPDMQYLVKKAYSSPLTCTMISQSNTLLTITTINFTHVTILKKHPKCF